MHQIFIRTQDTLNEINIIINMAIIPRYSFSNYVILFFFFISVLWVSVTWGVFNHLDLQTVSYSSRASSTCTQCLTVLKPREAKVNNMKTFVLVFVFLILAAFYTGRFIEQLQQYCRPTSIILGLR